MNVRWYQSLAGALLVGLLASSTGCAGASAMRRGEAQMASGDWSGAVATYRALCQGGGRNAEEACANLVRAEGELQGTAISDARLLMWDHEYAQAFQVLYDAKAQLSSTSAIEDAEAEVLADGVAYYQRLLNQGDNRGAYEGASTLSGLYPRDRDAEALLSTTVLLYAEELRGNALRAESESLFAAALAYWVTSYEVEPATEVAAHIDELRAELEDELRVGYYVEVLGAFGQSPTPSLPLDALAEVVAPDQADLSLRATLSRVRFDETYTSAILQHPYLAGTEIVANPAYATAQTNAEAAARTVEARRDEAERLRVALEQAQANANRNANTPDAYRYNSLRDQAQMSYDAAQRELNTARDAYNNAEAIRSGTPTTIEQEIWENYDYEQRTYTRTASADLNVATAIGSVTTDNHDTLSVRTVDTWHDGNQGYGLASDPLHYAEDDRTLENEVIESASNSIRSQLLVAFDAHRSHYADGFGSVTTADLTTIDELTRYVLLRPSNVTSDVERWLRTYVGIQDASHIVTVP